MKPASTTAHRWFLIAVPAVTVIALLFVSQRPSANETLGASPEVDASRTESSVKFNADGELVRPTGYRKWVYVGTPVTPNDMNDGKAPFPEFHNVYVNPDAYDQYEETGEFPNGTVLVKELVSVGSKEATSGTGYFMGDFIGLEVSIKDEGRYRDEPGNWAYFSFGHEYPLAATAPPMDRSACNACHQAAAAQDFVFTQYYPILRAADPAGSTSGDSATE